MRLTIVQYAGDYREAFDRFARGGKQTYYAQRYSVSLVGLLARQLDQVAVICALSDEKYDVVLDNGVRAIGAGLKRGFHSARIIPELIKTQPTRLSLMTPMLAVLKWANANHIRTIAPLADSFQKGGIRKTFQHRRLAYYLNRPYVDWVGNHGINACLSLLDIGVNSEKIIPWDWPAMNRPSDRTARSLRAALPHRLLYVGSVTETKGVGDLLKSMVHLRERGIKAKLSVIGQDPDGSMVALARSLNVSDIVDFTGIVANDDIPDAMRAADVVVIPSRHEYPEGLPLTIYEALSARTPIVASDHPMFRGALIDGESAVIFPAGRIDELTVAISRLLHDPALYEGISLRSEMAWDRIQLPVSLGQLFEAWVSDDPAQTEWIRRHRLTSGRYDERIKERSEALRRRS